MNELSVGVNVMKELYEVEREERFDLYRRFYQAYGEYTERMNGLVNDYYHTVPDDSGLGSIVVLERKTPGSNAGPFVYISSFRQDNQRQNSVVKETRSISIAEYHYALRWRFFRQSLRQRGKYQDLNITAIDQGPTTSHRRRAWQAREHYMQVVAGFSPETHWEPRGDERSKVRQVLEEAIGLVATLGFEDDVKVLTTEVASEHRQTENRYNLAL